MDYFFDTEARELEERRTVGFDLAREIAARGWIGVTMPRRYGGLGLGHLAKTVVLLDRRQACDAELMNAKLLNTESALTSARVALEVSPGVASSAITASSATCAT